MSRKADAVDNAARRADRVRSPTRSGSDARVTLRDVAELAGVHPATASRALNEETRGLVNEATVRRVMSAARTLAYRPDQLARGLKTRRSSLIGVLVPDLTNPLFPPIVRGIEDGLARRGLVALIGNTDNDAERERLVLAEMRSRAVDGLIAATGRRHHPLLADAAKSGLAIVLINRVVEDYRLPSVTVDDEIGVRAAVSHLASLGHRRIAHVAGPQNLSTGHNRYLGYRSSLRLCGIEADDSLVVFTDSYSELEGYRASEELFARGSRFTAILAGNDILALGSLRAFAARGLECPNDISLVGFNDIPMIDRISPPLTTVHVPHYEVGLEAAQMLLDRLADAEAPVKALLLAPDLVVRRSTAPPSAASSSPS